ncbi:MAG: NlpC/P60 family protein [Bacteroidetes bacterium]|nr:MAG: NlpC/P60 family protein [Bacteroidota bacterium]
MKQQHIPIVLGSSLPKFKDKSFFLGKLKYSFEGEAIFPFAKHKKKSSFGGVEEVSRWYLNTPYLWGGRSPFGIDCSGFTQMVYKLNGIKLQRDACQQAEQGKALSFLEEAKAGDLAFFDNEDGKIVHVGIITTSQPSPKEKESYAQSSPPLGEPKVGIQARREGLNFNIIHASGKVRIDKLDHQGIYNEEMKKYTHRLRVAKKY